MTNTPAQAPDIHIRLLTRPDAPAYQQLRLRSLQTDPSAFLSLYENECKLHDNTFGDHLDWAYHPPHFGYFGIFANGQLAGYAQVSQNYLEKQEHIAFISNVYVAPAGRGRGLATQLFTHILDLLAKNEKIERVFLSCTASNKNAYRFYQRLGFRRFAVKVKAIKWQGIYDDEVEMVKVL